tara:strand:+ start:41220 stop:41813 length:594 start_codon:yes stop_codon:yes gene_type:complete
VKRFIDVLSSILGIILLSPLFLLIGTLVYLNLGKPVLFVQNRPGKNGNIFKFYKFRTMKSLFGFDGVPLADHKRLTKLGLFLRSTSLDELPSLFNVLIGDMTLVGPRPLLEEYLPLYNGFQFRRHEVKPGITGWAQVNGRNGISWEEKFKLDIWYVDNHSLILDIKILFLTFKKVLLREGIMSDAQETMPKFKGSGE